MRKCLVPECDCFAELGGTYMEVEVYDFGKNEVKIPGGILVA